MNSLSWLLYFVNIVGNLGVVFTLATVATTVAAIAWILISHGSSAEKNSWNATNPKISHKVLFDTYKWYLFILFR